MWYVAVLVAATLLLWSRRVSAPQTPDASDVEALARMLASESSDRRVWPSLARAASNRAAARRTSLTGLLQTVVVGKPGGKRTTLRDQGWGPQYDGGERYRWASTRQPATAATREFARRYLGGGLSPDEERAADAVGASSTFFQGSPSAATLRGWGKTPADEVYAVAGWRFYA